jgi:hypothetical protein
MRANRCLEQSVWVWDFWMAWLGALLQGYTNVLCITYDLECRNSRRLILGRNSNMKSFDSRTSSSIEHSLLGVYDSGCECGGDKQVILGCWRLPPRFGRPQPCQRRGYRKKNSMGSFNMVVFEHPSFFIDPKALYCLQFL